MKKITFILLLISCQLIAQRTTIEGVISDRIGIVANAHVINETSKEGTFSDDKGQFFIDAKLGDILQVTSIQHYTKKMKVSSISMKRKKINILLVLEQHILEEIEVKKTQLQQVLTTDIKKTPVNQGVEKSKKAANFTMVDADKRVILQQEGGEDIATIVERNTDPILAFEGVSLLRFSIFTSNEEKRLGQRLKKEVFRDHLPERIIAIVGKHNLIHELKIPEDQLFKFLDYCIDEEIVRDVQREENLKVIQKIKRKGPLFLKEFKI
ncbi:hypothetical protein [Tenacibaculum amylolyticum]|uniref:hypothetical protein n=1 Tax=Tenacibaculum amylolyticum TaxID=104269 RepID=UPI00389303FF